MRSLWLSFSSFFTQAIYERSACTYFANQFFKNSQIKSHPIFPVGRSPPSSQAIFKLLLAAGNLAFQDSLQFLLQMSFARYNKSREQRQPTTFVESCLSNNCVSTVVVLFVRFVSGSYTKRL